MGTRTGSDSALRRLRPAGPSDPDATRRASSDWWTGSPQWVDPIPLPADDINLDDDNLAEDNGPDAAPRRSAGPLTGKHLIVLAAVVLVAALIAAYSLLSAKSQTPVEVSADPAVTPALPAPASQAPVSQAPQPPPAAPTDPSAAGSVPVPTGVRVHVLGAVHHPGVHELPAGARVIDAVDRSGGLSPDAAPGELNFAQPLADGQQIWIGTHADPGGEVRSPQAADPGSGAAPEAGSGPGDSGQPGSSNDAAGGLVNLNTASQAELEELPGVGPATAQKIITWREENGGFTAVEDLMEIRGIGEKTFAELAPLVTV